MYMYLLVRNSISDVWCFNSKSNKVVNKCMKVSFLFQFDFTTGLLLALFWTILVGLSRIYLGMHSALVSLTGPHHGLTIFMHLVFEQISSIQCLHKLPL